MTPYSLSLVEVYDHPTRYHVASRRAAEDVPPYLVDLLAFEGNGVCQCPHFACRLEPFLAQGMTAAVAFESGIAEVPPWGTVEDVLRCFHVHVARLKFADDQLPLYRNNEHTKQ